MDPLVSLHYYAPVSQSTHPRTPRSQAGLRNHQCLFHPFYRRISSFPGIIKNRSFDHAIQCRSSIWIERSGCLFDRRCRGFGLDPSGGFQGMSSERERTDPLGYPVDHLELFVFWKCHYADTDLWYVVHVGIWLIVGYALALAGLMTYKNASGK